MLMILHVMYIKIICLKHTYNFWGEKKCSNTFLKLIIYTLKLDRYFKKFGKSKKHFFFIELEKTIIDGY